MQAVNYAVVNYAGERVEGVSVVMVSYWTGPVLSTVIEAVLAPDQEGMAELILVDNGNPPPVVRELVEWAQVEPRLTLIRGHGNVGFARGCNIGSRRARGRYLLLLNPDCHLERGAIPALLATAAGLGNHWMLGCRVLNPDGSDQRGSRRALLTPYTALVEVFQLDKLVPRWFRAHRFNHHDNPLPEATTRVPVISGACMMLPAATFQSVGGMDAGYFLHVDDLDLCLRLHRADIPVYYVPHVKAIHHAGSSRSSPIGIEWHKARGFLRYFRLHFHGPRRFPVLVLLGVGILARFGVKALQSLLGWGRNRQPERHDSPPSRFPTWRRGGGGGGGE